MSNCKANATEVRRLTSLTKCVHQFSVGILFAFLAPRSAWAVQIHGAPEGLYVHQGAHLIFSVALVFLLYKLDRNPPGVSKGWRFLKLSLFFFLLWNIDTFTVHLLSIRLPDDALMTQGDLWDHRLLGPISTERLVYYLGRFDHLFCVPAMWFLVRSLHEFCHEADQRLDQSNGEI